MDTPARHQFNTDGSTKVFPIPTPIKGDDYIRIEIGGVHQTDRALWDIIQNSIVFINAPTSGQLLDVQVATSEEALGQLGSVSNVDIVAGAINLVSAVGSDIDNVNTVGSDIDNVNIIAPNIDNVNAVGSNIDNVNITAEAISGGGSVTGGQFTGGGITKPLIYTSKVVTEDTTIVNGTNALAIDSLEVADGVTLTLEDEVAMKVV